MAEKKPLRALIIEDRPEDAELLLRELRRGGYDPEARVVSNEEEYIANLDASLDIILSDFNLPTFDAVRALRILKRRRLDVPLIVVTGILSDEAAVGCIKQGAFDYLLKDRLARLGQAVAHALDERKLAAAKRAAEEEAELHKARLEAVFSRTRDVLLLFDDEGRVVDANPAACAGAGRTRDDLVGTPVWELTLTGRGTEIRDLWDVFLSAGSLEGERETRTPEGEPREIEFLAVANIVPGVHMAVVRDVTAKKKTERALLQSQKLESLGVMAAGIAHDFNNLLVAVLGNADLALIDLSPESPARESIDQVKVAARRAADLARQMLALSGRGTVSVQPIDLNTMVEEMTQVLKASISRTAVLKFNLAPEMPSFEADATQVRQIIVNLVVNASDAIGTKSGVISMTTGVMRATEEYLAGALKGPNAKPGDYAFLEVSDTGAGMDEATRLRVFDPFFTTKFSGRGLGLAAVLSVVRAHEGAVRVYSEPGRGTTFKVLLPLTPSGTATTPEGGVVPANWRGAGKALVADDEETVLALTARALEAMGFASELAADGREAVEKFRQDPAAYSLVLLDMTMPGMGGSEAFSEIRRIRPDAVVLLMSGYNEEETTVQLAGKRLSGFIQKPFELSKLRETVWRATSGGPMVR